MYDMKPKRNIFANGIGRVWQAALQFLFAPVFLGFLGTEAYGLVTFYTMLLLTIIFLEQAVTAPLTRRIASSNARPEETQHVWDLLRTSELINISIGILIGASVIFLAPIIVENLIPNSSIDQEETILIVRLMGFVLACQWQTFLYAGGFIGLHRQDVLAIIRATVLSIQYIGAFLLLWLVSPSILIFFIWQAITFAILSLLMRFFLWRCMPKAAQPGRFRIGIIQDGWRFGLGAMTIGFSAALLTQIDKFIISKNTSLESLASYNLCFMAAVVIGLLASPFQSILLPRFVAKIGQKEAALAADYSQWTQVVAFVTLPIGTVLIAFPNHILFLWLGDQPRMIEEMAFILPIIVAGSIFNTLMSVPYALQLAAGWTKLSVIKNIIALIIIVPGLVYLVPIYGLVAGAVAWFILNLSYFVIEVPAMHMKLLRQSMRSWYIKDTLMPIGICLCWLVFLKAFVPPGLSNSDMTAIVLISVFVPTLILSIALPTVRKAARRGRQKIAITIKSSFPNGR